jgi:hypothetical protein
MKSIICLLVFSVALQLAESNQWCYVPRKRRGGNFIRLENCAAADSNAIAINNAACGSANAVANSDATNVNAINQSSL